MDIKTAIETAKKIKQCWFKGGYYCSLNGCDNCGNYFDAKEELEMLEAFIELGEKQNRNTNLTVEVDGEVLKSHFAEADIAGAVRCKDCIYRAGIICTKPEDLLRLMDTAETGGKK